MPRVGPVPVIPGSADRKDRAVRSQRQRPPRLVAFGFAVDIGTLLASRAAVPLIDTDMPRVGPVSVVQTRADCQGRAVR